MKKIKKQPDGTIVLYPVNWNLISFSQMINQPQKTAVVINLKTTGIDYSIDEIVELDYIKFKVDAEGCISKIIKEGVFFQEPKKPLTQQIQEINFLNNNDLIGQNIDWNLINKDLEDVDLIISYNASFERPFLEKKIKHTNTPWVCAYSQIPWSAWGFPKKNLELLCFNHGFYFEDESGLQKCKAILILLQNKEKETIYLKFLLNTLSEKSYLVIALKSDFESKWFFNQNKFSFNRSLNMWFKFFDSQEKEMAESIFKSMKEVVYEGVPFSGKLMELDSTQRFKPLSDFSQINSEEIIFTKEPIGKNTKPFMLIAKNLDLDHALILNERLYSWIFTGKKHEWIIYVTEEEANREKKWLTENLYLTHFKGVLQKNKDFK